MLKIKSNISLAASVFLLSLASSNLVAQNQTKFLPLVASDNVNKVFSPTNKQLQRKEIITPTVSNFRVLKGDVHLHTMFSDGLVWPSYRVDEAWSDGLDFLAITDHIEYRPFKDYVSGDLNISYDLAIDRANELDIELIKGIEITRKQGVLGHFGALFIKDANAIKIDDPKASIMEAVKQGAYIIFNHPAWALDTCMFTEFQQKLYEQNIIKAVEVVNNHEFYPRALSWSKDLKLTVIGASDSHEPVIEAYTQIEDNNLAPRYRAMTLLFVDDSTWEQAMAIKQQAQRSEARQKLIRQALELGNTLAYHNGNIVGREDLLKELFMASVKINNVSSTEKNNHYKIDNNSSFPFYLQIADKEYYINPMSSINIPVSKTANINTIKVLNMQYYEFKNLIIDYKL